jgi:hypothetical protein
LGGVFEVWPAPGAREGTPKIRPDCLQVPSLKIGVSIPLGPPVGRRFCPFGAGWKGFLSLRGRRLEGASVPSGPARLPKNRGCPVGPKTRPLGWPEIIDLGVGRPLPTDGALRSPPDGRGFRPWGPNGQSAPKTCTLCYTVVLPGRKSDFRAGFWPDCYRERTEISALRPAFGRPEGRFRFFHGSSPATIRPGRPISAPEATVA